MANRGDTIQLVIDFTYNDVPIAELDPAPTEIELQLGKQGSTGALKLTLSDGRITLDTSINKYVATLTQAETMIMPRTVKYQMRIEVDGVVSSNDIDNFNIGDMLSTAQL